MGVERGREASEVEWTAQETMIYLGAIHRLFPNPSLLASICRRAVPWQIFRRLQATIWPNMTVDSHTSANSMIDTKGKDLIASLPKNSRPAPDLPNRAPGESPTRLRYLSEPSQPDISV